MIPVRVLKKHSYGSRRRYPGETYPADDKHVEFMIRAGLAEIPPPPKRAKIVAREVSPPPPEPTPVERFEADLSSFAAETEEEPVSEKPRKARRTYRRRDMEADKE
jgi:hypothetical protein